MNTVYNNKIGTGERPNLLKNQHNVDKNQARVEENDVFHEQGPAGVDEEGDVVVEDNPGQAEILIRVGPPGKKETSKRRECKS